MKNKFAITLVCLVLLAVGLGCSSINPLASNDATASNKTLTETGVDTVIGEEKIGVPECDEVLDMLTLEINNPDDSFITKAGKSFFLNKIKESVRESIVTNKGDTAKLAKECGNFKKQLVKYKAEEAKKKTK